MLSEREGDHGAEAAAGVCRMKGTWSFRVIPINQIANFYRHELWRRSALHGVSRRSCCNS